MSKFQDDEAAEAAFHEYRLQEKEEEHEEELWEAFKAGWEGGSETTLCASDKEPLIQGFFKGWLRETGRA